MTSAAETATVLFESIGAGTEIWGGTQANFLVVRPGHHAKESAVVVNDPAAAFLAELLGQQDTADFREAVARHVGGLWLEIVASRPGAIPSLVFLSRAAIESTPGLVDRIRVLAGRMAPQHDAEAPADH